MGIRTSTFKAARTRADPNSLERNSGFQFLVFRIRVSGSGLWIPGFDGSRVSVFGTRTFKAAFTRAGPSSLARASIVSLASWVRDSGLGFRFRFQFSGFGIRVSIFGIWYSNFGIRDSCFGGGGTAKYFSWRRSTG